jgi:hypothetical protein
VGGYCSPESTTVRASPRGSRCSPSPKSAVARDRGRALPPLGSAMAWASTGRATAARPHRGSITQVESRGVATAVSVRPPGIVVGGTLPYPREEEIREERCGICTSAAHASPGGYIYIYIYTVLL